MSRPKQEDYLAIDCEMVQVRSRQALAKIGIVDYGGKIILESYVFVHPQNVLDWRSESSGIRPGDLDGAPTFEEIQKIVKKLVEGKIIVGHAVFNDLAALQIRHPYEMVRDTALYYPLRQLLEVNYEGQYPSLKKLSEKVMGVDIQTGTEGHCPVEDARATMELFQTVREAYESSLLKNEDIVAGVPESFVRWYW